MKRFFLLSFVVFFTTIIHSAQRELYEEGPWEKKSVDLNLKNFEVLESGQEYLALNNENEFALYRGNEDFGKHVPGFSFDTGLGLVEVFEGIKNFSYLQGLLVACCYSNKVTFCDMFGDEIIFVEPLERREFLQVVGSKDGFLCAVRDSQAIARLYDIRTKRIALHMVHPLLTEKDQIADMKFNEDNQIITVSGSGNFYVWDTRNIGRSQPVKCYKSKQEGIKKIFVHRKDQRNKLTALTDAGSLFYCKAEGETLGKDSGSRRFVPIKGSEILDIDYFSNMDSYVFGIAESVAIERLSIRNYHGTFNIAHFDAPMELIKWMGPEKIYARTVDKKEFILKKKPVVDE